MRRLVSQTRLSAADLVLPVFVREGVSAPVPISSMPGVVQHTRESLKVAAHEAVEAGIGGLMLFGVPTPEHKDAEGTWGTRPDGILNAALEDLRSELGDASVLMADLCLDEFTDHGHCGVLTPAGAVDNDATLERYAAMALAQARAGSQLLGLSGMMDGQVAAVRDALEAEGFIDTIIMAYSAKYAGAFYGPFREAVDSQLTGDRRTYQMDPPNAREGVREAIIDVDEGADIVMVKPGLPYLDVLADVRASVDVPVWAYQVSGEYSMVEAAAEKGWIDRRATILDSLTAFGRAGADAILTYWATEAAGWIREGL